MTNYLKIILKLVYSCFFLNKLKITRRNRESSVVTEWAFLNYFFIVNILEIGHS